MKKAMWMITAACFFLTAAAMFVLPEVIPMHYNLEGEIDRWGSKYELFLEPVITFVFCLIFHLMIRQNEKKENDILITEKERAEARSNAKVLKIINVASVSFFMVMQVIILYGAYIEAKTHATHASVDFGKATLVLTGILFIVAGNFLPKAKKNRIAGVRTEWSMYNDTTWMKSNRFGGYSFVVMGIALIVTAFFVQSSLAVILLIVYVIADTIAILAYSYRVYRNEIKKVL